MMEPEEFLSHILNEEALMREYGIEDFDGEEARFKPTLSQQQGPSAPPPVVGHGADERGLRALVEELDVLVGYPYPRPAPAPIVGKEERKYLVAQVDLFLPDNPRFATYKEAVEAAKEESWNDTTVGVWHPSDQSEEEYDLLAIVWQQRVYRLWSE